MTGAVRKVGVVLLVAALVGSLLFVTATPALTQPIRVRIKLGVSDRTPPKDEKVIFFGRLKSRNKKCIRNSTVLLKRKGAGVVDADKTDRQGEFFFVVKPRRGRYVAKFRGKTITKPGYGYGYGGETRRCRKAKSRVIRIRPAR